MNAVVMRIDRGEETAVPTNKPEEPSQPMQPIVWDEHGTIRFKANSIVRFLLDEATDGQQCDLNKIVRMDFPKDDVEQFWQMLGYSLNGYGELSFVRDKTYNKAARRAKKLRAETEKLNP